jgi:hypothetical protein
MTPASSVPPATVQVDLVLKALDGVPRRANLAEHLAVGGQRLGVPPLAGGPLLAQLLGEAVEDARHRFRLAVPEHPQDARGHAAADPTVEQGRVDGVHSRILRQGARDTSSQKSRLPAVSWLSVPMLVTSRPRIDVADPWL